MTVALLACACSSRLTTDQLRDRARGTASDSTWLQFPCQGLNVDPFGWPRHELEGVSYRTSPTLNITQRLGVREMEHRSSNERRWMRIRLIVGPIRLRPEGFPGQGLNGRRTELCSLNDRVVDVATGYDGLDVATVMWWRDAGQDRWLELSARARTAAEGQLLRATAFTFVFPE